MQLGIDSFAAAFDENSLAVNPAERLRQLVQQIEHADEVGLDAFGVGGTPQSFVRAGQLGLPLMVAIIGGEPRRFRPLIDLYRATGMQHGACLVVRNR